MRLSIERLFDGNMREALAMLRSILEYSEPGAIRVEADQKFIQNYLDRNAVNTFLQFNVLPNLYDRLYRSTPFPLAIDILCTVRHIRNEDLIRGVVNIVTESRAAAVGIVEDSKIVKMRGHDYDFSVHKLIDLGLLGRQGRSLHLTPKGDLLAQYVVRPHYQERCREMIHDPNEEDKVFWRLAGVSIDHWDVVLQMMAWDKRQGENQ